MNKIALIAAAFATSAVAAEKKPTIDAEHTVEYTSTVKSVNQKKRVVTLTGKDGSEVTFTADQRVKNLAQLKAGDEVAITLVESLKARVLDPGEEPKGAALSSLDTAPLGAKPGARSTENLHIVARVDAIDAPNMTVTLRGPDGTTSPVKARSNANLEKLKVGDNIEIRMTRTLAVEVKSKVPAK
jgi:hypothetical protein